MLAMLPGVARLGTDNSPAVFFVRDAPELERYQRFRADFGGDESLRIVLGGEAVWSREGLRFAAELERRAAKLPGVRAATGLVALLGGDSAVWPATAAAAIRERAQSDPLAGALGVVGRNGATVTIPLVLEPLDKVEQERLLAALERLGDAAPAGVTAGLVGFPALERALDRSVDEVYRRSFPLLVLAAALLLALAFRGARAVLLPLLFVGFCEVVPFGLMGYAGVTLNLGLTVLPPVLFVIALASAVHVLTRFRAQRAGGLEPEAAVRATYREKGAALAWTAASTFAGFGSLAVSAVGPVHALGLWAMVGIAVMAIAAFTLLPALLLVLGDRGAARRPLERRMERFGCALAEHAVDRRRLVYALTAAAAVLALAGLPRLQVESNTLHYLAADHPVRTRFEALERAGVGTAAVELVLADRGEGGFATEERLARLVELTARLRRETSSLGVVAVTDFVDSWQRRTAAALPFGLGRGLGARAPALQLLRHDPRGAPAVAALLSADSRRARVTLLVPTGGYPQVEALAQRARAITTEIFPAATVEVTGQYPLLLETQKRLVGTLGASFALTLAAVAAILYLLLRRVRLTLLAMVPNVLPVVWVFGAMAWLGVPIDISTVMVASTTLGLALDDTIHTLVHYRRSAREHGAAGAVLAAVERNAAAYSLTGLVLGLGFAVCAFSSFIPTQRFGALSAFAIVLAVLADFLLVPALFGGASERMVRTRLRGTPP